jgi:ABC-type lipoprotein release transport system permease subunit
MKTIIKIAWRNLWRNKLRTTVIIISIILGLWGSLFFMAMINGMNDNRISSAINTYLGHIQIHQKTYLEDPKMDKTIVQPDKVIAIIKQTKNVKAYAPHTIIDAMLTTAKGNQGVKITGVLPGLEKNISNIPTHLYQGTYLTRFKKPAVIIGKALADKLHLKINSKVKISFQNLQGDILSYAFRVEGIYKVNNDMLEKMQVYVKQKDLTKLLGLSQSLIHEIVVKLDRLKDAPKVKKLWQPQMSGNLVQTWDEVSPELGYAQEMMATFSYIFMVIILMALSFAIINTMLMAILERKRELGIMVAIGFNKRKLFWMIMLETLFLAAVATPIGMLLSYWTIEYFGRHGMTFLSVAKGLEHYGMSATIYTKLDKSFYMGITILTLTTALLAAIYPAVKALSNNPIEAIREI